MTSIKLLLANYIMYIRNILKIHCYCSVQIKLSIHQWLWNMFFFLTTLPFAWRGQETFYNDNHWRVKKINMGSAEAWGLIQYKDHISRYRDFHSLDPETDPWCFYRGDWALSQYKDSLSRYGNLHYKDKTVMRQSYFYNANSHTGKMTSLY